MSEELEVRVSCLELESNALQSNLNLSFKYIYFLQQEQCLHRDLFEIHFLPCPSQCPSLVTYLIFMRFQCNINQKTTKAIV